MDNHSSSLLSFINIFILLFFVVVVAVVSSFATYYFLSSKLNQQPTEIAQPTVIPQTQPSDLEGQPNVLPTSSAVDETADWKTYRNEKYGYEVKYPANLLQLVDNTTPQSGGLYNTSLNAIKQKEFDFDKDKYSTYAYAIEIEISNNEHGTNDRYFSEQSKYLSNTIEGFDTWEIVNFAGKKWIETWGYPGLYQAFQLATPHNQYIYELSFSAMGVEKINIIPSDPDGAEGLIIFKQILSTFKFID